ncbi:TPA: hypothetical protein OR198_003705 [Escherichia coli]|nr:hypothetical protein [Escherichia coli]
MINKKEREISLEDIEDYELDEWDEDETYIDPTTTSLTQEEDDEPVSTIKALFFIIHLGLYRIAGMCLNEFVRVLAYIYGRNINLKRRVEEYIDSVSYRSAKSTSNLNRIEQAFKKQSQRDLKQCIWRLPPGYKKKGLDFISKYKSQGINDNANIELGYNSNYQTIHPFNFTNVESGRLKTVYFCYDIKTIRKDIIIDIASTKGYTCMQYSVNDHLYNEGMRVIVYSFLLKDENTGYELNLDIWDYFIDRVEDDDYIYQYTEYRTEINGLDIYSLVSKKYKMHEITKESLNIRLVFEENNNEPPVKKKRL